MIDIYQPRREYLSREFSLEHCPECKGPLVEHTCTILFDALYDNDEGKFMTNLAGSHFCERCPVVVFDSDKVEQAAGISVPTGKLQAYHILGMVNLDAIPEEKRSMELGTDENPIPLVSFLPDLPGVTGFYSLNGPCPCGSGKKYKRCCGASRSRSRLRRR